MAVGRPDRRCCAAGLILVASAIVGSVALADEPPVPLYTPEEIAAFNGPMARMIDEATCEVVSPVMYQKKYVVADAGVVLYRSRSRRPFMQAVTREDGVFVARFTAKPGETIYVRAYRGLPKKGGVILGNAARAVCVPGTVSVGEVSPVEGDADGSVTDP